MPKRLERYRLLFKDDYRCSVAMPRRARIVSGEYINPKAFQLYAEVEFDESTEAFDTKQHKRHFRGITNGDTLPEGGLVAADGGFHIYEVKG